MNQQALHDYWQSHLKRWESSGLSGKHYCQQKQLAYHCFIYWRRKLLTRTTPPTAANPPAPATGFIVVRPTIPQTNAVCEGLQLQLLNGLVINNIQPGNLAMVRPLLEQL